MGDRLPCMTRLIWSWRGSRKRGKGVKAEKMIYIVDNILNYFIYLFILYFGFRLRPRSQKIFLGLSVSVMLCAGGFNAYFDINSPAVYIFWSVLSISLFFEERLGHFACIKCSHHVFYRNYRYIQRHADTDCINRRRRWHRYHMVDGNAYLLSFLIYLFDIFASS